MAETILINFTSSQTRVAVVVDGRVRDLHIERSAQRGMVGNIYAGRVTRVLPGMQTAFVDIGADRMGLVRVADLASRVKPQAGVGEGAIEHRLHEGQELLVQVTRDPLGNKGARLTTALSLASRFLVYLPGSTQIAVSQRIPAAGERARLLLALQQALAAEDMEEEGGFILRTAAEDAQPDELRADLRFLHRQWAAVRRRSRQAQPERLLYEELPLHLRVARDLARPSLDRILVDDRAGFLALTGFCRDYVPELSDLLEHYTGSTPLFDRHGVEDEIQTALSRRVDLDSGGYLLIEQTEAMTAVDVNTGAFVGRRRADETVLRTNLEAAAALARQLRLRNIGGIIAVDFIDMPAAEHRRQLETALRGLLQDDPEPTTCTAIPTPYMLVITRRRSGESLQTLLCEDCPECHGSGKLKSARSVCQEIFREISRVCDQGRAGELVVVAAPAVVALLQEEAAAELAGLGDQWGRSIRLRAEPRYGRGHFDIAVH